ncbi:MAG TPA: CehA/McbA family metallohydrolase [Gemmatimonadales bacterium]|nr:CehA/McbA family metallohydrolase [Gemmatimonadales bacterium]
MRLAGRLLLATLAQLMVLPSAEAQRAPVLRQVKTPHPYYFREMLIPQVTTGPTGPAWSPDGTELIYSMSGSLWRQRPGEGEARQVTDGPGYDYQPDWSPDGRRVVYASYRDDAIELRLLDLASGESLPLVANGAVNIEPRWSPDGGRIAFTSSVHEGLWHVFVVSVDSAGAAGRPTRITPDRDSGLPRYYYHRKDQYFSPTWSPDGRELVLISNRGRIWGSGGFWRVEARPGGREREIHFEETTWKARPDWSRDGRRVVYSSYLGRQWNQLWLMTSEGGDPLQLTYGEYDVTTPRWSPAGDRIAYVSNEGGNTSLWVLELPAGGRKAVRIDRRHALRPSGTLRIAVAGTGGAALPARISVQGEDGRSHAPDSAWHHADDAFDRAERRLEYGYFHTSGSATLRLPAGRYAVEVSRGPEYRVISRTVQVAPDEVTPLQVSLPLLDDLEARGWYSGDLHVHMNYGGVYRNDPARLAFQARAEDLHVVENLVVNKEGRVPDVGYFQPGPDPASSPGTLIAHGEEYHTSYWGHVGLLGLREHLILPGYAAYANTAVASLQPTNARVFDIARAQGAVTGYVHPYDLYPDPTDTARALTHALPVDLALGKVDYYEALGFVDDLDATAKVWYRLLNCGFRLSAGAGTDAMANYASLRGPVGMNRVYVKSGGPLEHRRWLAALKAGRSFATNGPLIEMTVDGIGLGGEVRLPEGGRDVTVSVRLRSNVPVDRLELVRSGQVVQEFPISDDGRSATTTAKIPVDRSGWVLLRARGDRPAYPTLDVYPYATTSPVYLTVGDQPTRSPEDARYFIAWIDRMRLSVESHRDWNSDAERRETLDMLAQARAEYERRSGE